MPYEYEYERPTLTTGPNTGSYAVDNPDRVDGGGKQIRLAKEVEEDFELVGLTFRMRAAGSLLTFEFDNELTQDQHDGLSSVVYDHINNV